MAAAGEVVGVGELDAAADSGELAGLDAAHALQFGDAKSKAAADKLRQRLDEVKRPDVAVAPAAVGGEPRQVLCVPVRGRDRKDIKLSIDEGYDSIELAKRYTTVTMGPCQGRMCQLPAIRLMAQDTGQSSATSARPRPGRRGCRCRWGSSAAARSSPPSARRSTAATASWAATSSGPATGAGPTTTATRRPRRWRSTAPPA